MSRPFGRLFCCPARFVVLLATVPPLSAQAPESLAVPADSARWDLQGQAKAAEVQGRQCLQLDGGAAVLKDFEMRDAVVDVDVTTTGVRGFFGFQFRIDTSCLNAEEVYLRPHKTGMPDALQYTPILSGGRDWQIYNGDGFTAPVDIPKDT